MPDEGVENGEFKNRVLASKSSVGGEQNEYRNACDLPGQYVAPTDNEYAVY